ncbi:MAG: FAD-dependent oxidoreductase, partial [Moraxellaceae bacterium]
MKSVGMKVVVIGGGIIGLMTALELSQAGCEVSILDSQDLGQAASWAGGGILSPMYPWRYPLAVNQLARYGREIYQHWQPILQAATGQDIEINPSGMLILDQADFEIGLNWAAQMQDSQQSAQLLDAAQLSALVPPLNPSIEQGLWFSQLANIRNPRLLKTLIAFLQLQPNVSLHAHCAVAKFETLPNSNHINAVIDQHGQRWQADHYV